MPDAETQLINIPASILAAMQTHIATRAPDEACGLLAGSGTQVLRHFAIPNVSKTPETAYVMEPQAMVSALIEIESSGQDLLCIYHSHPPGYPVYPSESDISQDNYPGVIHIIVGLNKDLEIAATKAFVIDKFEILVEAVNINVTG